MSDVIEGKLCLECRLNDKCDDSGCPLWQFREAIKTHNKIINKMKDLKLIK